MYECIRDRFDGGVTGGWDTDRFPKIQSGSLIDMLKKGVFWYF